MNRKLVLMVLLLSIMPLSSLISQWQQSDAPNIGQTSSLVACGTDLYASFNGGGVYRSTNNGELWVDITNCIKSRYVTSLFVSGTSIYAGAAGKIYRTCNNGCEWTEVSEGLPVKTNINGFAEIGTDLFVATTHGVFVSKDHANLWAPANSGLGSTDVSCIMAAGNDLFAGSWTAGIYKSVDKGASWARANAGMYSKTITAFARVGDRLFAGATNGIYISYSNGSYWKFKELGINQVTSFAVAGNTIIAGGLCNEGSVLAMSTNAGDTWMCISDGIIARYIKGIVIKGSEVFVGCNYTGLHSTTAPFTNWKQINNGIKAASVSVMATDGEDILCATKGSGIYLSKDDGKTWSKKNTGLRNGFVQTILVKGSEIYAGTLYGIYRSVDKGNNWKEIMRNIPIYCIGYDSYRLFAGGVGKIYLSLDNGVSWYKVSYGIPANAIVNSIYVHGRVVYAATSVGLFVSNTSGTNWTEIGKGLPCKDIRALIVTGGKMIIGTYGGGIWISSDNGGSWTSMCPEHHPQYVEALIMHGNTIFAAADYCIFIGKDMGKEWECIASGLPDAPITRLAINSNRLFAGLDGAGVWSRCLCDIFHDEGLGKESAIANALPKDYQLMQNSPNPFNPSTTFEFALPKDEHVVLRIYNTLGQEVETLINEGMNAGVHKYTWVAKNLTSGVYIYYLNAGNFTQAKKLVLMK